MTIDKLKSVNNFIVECRYAKIEFDEEVDLVDVDLDKMVKIAQCRVEIYPADDYPTNRPKPGEKINHAAFVTLKEFGLGQPTDFTKGITQIKKLSKAMNATVVDVDYKQDILKLYIKHF